MWRLICLAFFGAFAWGMTWETYGAQISEHTTKIINAVKVHIPPKYPCSCFASLQIDTPQCGVHWARCKDHCLQRLSCKPCKCESTGRRCAKAGISAFLLRRRKSLALR